MIYVTARNVHEALPEACLDFANASVIRNSRNGKVRQMPGVFATEYRRPMERVVFQRQRDANPFFHFFESLWMLAGRHDVEFPNQFCSDGMSRFSDNGKTLNGAYGWRWRTHFGYDQLTEIVENLQRNPECRRQVLTMWDGRDDLLNRTSKDVPCNDMATFQICPAGNLDMVVFNRSNDLIWGAYGANAVHFSFLQEWMAMMIGVPVGIYTQVSANTHIYEQHWEMMQQLADRAPDVISGERPMSPYRGEIVEPFPIGHLIPSKAAWNTDLENFFRFGRRSHDSFETAFFRDVVCPMWWAHDAFRQKDNPTRIEEALGEIEDCRASDWHLACEEWLLRRKK